jgi:hypothetical protein
VIRFACHTWAFADLTLTEALGTIARMGFAQVDLGSGTHLNLVKAAADGARISAEIIGDLRVYHLQVSDVALLMPGLSDPSEQSRELDLFRAVIPTLQQLQAAGVTIITEMTGLTSVGPLIEALQTIVKLAEGLPVSLETPLEALVNGQIAAILAEVPDLQLTLPATAWGSSQGDLTAWQDRVRHVIVPPAADGTTLQTMMNGLQAQNYQGVITIHPNKSQRTTPIQEAIRVRDLLKSYRK